MKYMDKIKLEQYLDKQLNSMTPFHIIELKGEEYKTNLYSYSQVALLIESIRDFKIKKKVSKTEDITNE